jgi:tRNA threonylcarbamoyladenosine biosynthesis protein TsaB
VRILGIDTALGACSVALLDGDHVVARAHEPMQRGHAEALAPMVESVMRKSSLAFSTLGRIAVTTGPGTFTGQRVGLAFSRALALALKIPIVGVTTLDAMVAQALSQDDADWAVAVSDAKRGEFYLGARSSAGETLIVPSVLEHEAAVEQVLLALGIYGSNLALAGTGAELLRSLLGREGKVVRSSKVQQPDAVFVARIGLDLPHSDSPPRPLYLRAPDAKLPKRATV